MSKPIFNTKTYSRIYIVSLFIIGGGFGALMLILNQQFHVTVSVASLFSPTGARVVVGGVRIKHWMVGLAFIGLGVGMVLNSSKTAFLKEVGILISGTGAVLFGDELIDRDF